MCGDLRRSVSCCFTSTNEGVCLATGGWTFQAAAAAPVVVAFVVVVVVVVVVIVAVF